MSAYSARSMEYAVLPASLQDNVCVVMGSPKARSERLSRSKDVRRASSASGYWPLILLEMSSKVSGTDDSVSRATRFNIRSVALTEIFLLPITGRIEPILLNHIHYEELFFLFCKYQSSKGCVRVNPLDVFASFIDARTEPAIVFPNSTPN